MIKNNKKIIIAISIIIIIVLAIVTGTVLLKNKKSVTELTKEKKEDYSVKLTNKFTENESVQISIENIAYADKYLIIDYTVKAKNEEEPFFIENYAKKNEFGFYMDRTVKIDGELVKLKDDYSDQISYKISDTEAKVYDILEVEELPEKFNLEVKFLENDFTTTQDTDAENDEEIYEELEDNDEVDDELEDNDFEEYEDNSEERESLLTEEDEEIKDEDIEEWEDEEIEDDEEELSEEVEGYYDGTEETEENEKAEETEETDDIEVTNKAIGTITTKANKEELIKDVLTTNYDEKYEENNILIENQKILKTSFKTFIITETTIKEVRYQDIQSNLLGDPLLYKIDIEDEEGNTININQVQQVTITDEEETKLNDLEIDDENIPNNLIAKIKTISILGDEAKETIKLQPYYYSYDFQNDDIETAMQHKEWFKIEDDEYTETNSYDGEITIEKVEEKDNQILFYYTKKGFMPDVESTVLLKNSTKEFNVFYPDIIKLKGINSEENIVGYNIENNTSYSYTEDFDDDNLGNIKDLEFTLLEGLEIEKIGEGFILDI